MNANPKFLSATASVDEAAVKPLPNSRKVYVEGSRPDIRVPMREITQSDTPVILSRPRREGPRAFRTTRRSSSTTRSGPYTDPAVKIDIRSGLAPLRQKWIEERSDTEELTGPSSRYGRERLADPKLAELRFNLKRKPRRAKPGMNVIADALRAPRHRSRPRWSTSPSARTSAWTRCSELVTPAARGRVVRRGDPEADHARSSCATRSRAAAPSFPPTSTTRKPSR